MSDEKSLLDSENDFDKIRELLISSDESSSELNQLKEVFLSEESSDPEIQNIQSLIEGQSQKDFEMDFIRETFLGEEKRKIDSLIEKIDNQEKFAKKVSSVLPISVKDEEIVGDLSESLSPIIVNTINKTVTDNPQPLVDALFPIIGPMIRKSISNSIKEMMQFFNEAMENSISPKGIKWRIEAIRTNRPFGEVVLLNSLDYRVEQIFLIHKETGLVLNHITADDTVAQDPDLVSGMLTAIQDFVQDSFGGNKESTLDTLQVGELVVWLEESPEAVLAAVIRGSAPLSLRDSFREMLEKIHFHKGKQLGNFEGDSSDFNDLEDDLKSCLKSKKKENLEETKSSNFLFGLIVIVILIFSILFFFWYQNNSKWTNFYQSLNNLKGVVITSVENKNGKSHIYGLKDKYSDKIEPLISKYNISKNKVIYHFEPYYSLDENIILQRLIDLTPENNSIKFYLEGGFLKAEGKADHSWVEKSKNIALSMPGILNVDFDNVIDTNIKELDVLKDKVEDYIFTFSVGNQSYNENKEYTLEIVEQINKLSEVAGKFNKKINIILYGFADKTGDEDINLKISKLRAAYVLKTMKLNGLIDINSSIVGKGFSGSIIKNNKEYNKVVTIKVNIE